MGALDDWLARGAGFDCEYGGGLSNHLPMALLALQQLGADDDRLHAWASNYVVRLAPAPAAQPWPAGDAWASRLGEREAWPAYRALFREWLDAEAAGEVLAQVLPVLMRGVGAAAFHGLIRTACAVRLARRAELADALAYWACRWLPLSSGGDDAATPGDEPDPARLLPRLGVPTGRHGLIFEAMDAAARLPGFDTTVARLAIDADTVPRLARLAADVMARSGGNFVVMHLITSAHAMTELLGFVDDPLDAVRHYARAYAAAAAASGARPAPTRPGTAPPWHELQARALASADDHAAKRVWSCRELERLHGGTGWRAAAAAVAG
jgi:hypothetical protein